jgi:DegV family protein with EDD domain
MVAVVADSASNLPEGLADELGVQVVPLWLRFGEAAYRDGVDMPPGRFYERLVRDDAAPSTAAPSPADFLEAFERTRQRDVVCITVASTMSAAHHVAGLAAERFDGTVVVVDSANASMAEGFVVLEAARSARAGGSLERVVERARSVADGASLLATVGTFEFLQRSGRVNKLQAYAATMLDINPVFSFLRGDAAPVARPRTRRRAVERLTEETVRAIGTRPAHVAVIHASAPLEAEALMASLLQRLRVVEHHVVEVTPVIGAHTGPSLLGTAFFSDGH